MNNTELTTVTHEIINFRVPAELKIRFANAADKEMRTVSQQLRVLMLQFIAEAEEFKATAEQIAKVEKNISESKVTRHEKKKPHFTRGK